EEEAAGDPTDGMDPDEAVHWKILHRKKDGVEELVERAILRRTGPGSGSGRGPGSQGEPPAGEVLRSLTVAERDAAAVDVLNNVLLPAMKEVGDKFGAGELILPFVLQSAEVMKRAVARLEQYLEKK